MTAEEIKVKKDLKANLRQMLIERRRKIKYYQKALKKAEEAQKKDITEHNLLDREIFEATHVVKVSTEKRAIQIVENSHFGKRPKRPKKPDYEKLSLEERQGILNRLLEIQRSQDEKQTYQKFD